VFNVGNQKISIAASTALASTWRAWLDENAPKEFGTHTDAANYLKTAANTILTDAAARAGMSAFGAGSSAGCSAMFPWLVVALSSLDDRSVTSTSPIT
jgi:hypothetical protein